MGAAAAGLVAAALIAFRALGGADAGVTAIRAFADGAAALTLGLALAPALEEPRHRPRITAAIGRPLLVAAGCWLVAELLRMALAAAAAAAVPVSRLPLRVLTDFAFHTAPGRAAVATVVAAAVVGGVAAARVPGSGVATAVAGITAAGIAARAVTGHLADQPVAAAAVAVHALAAAAWVGTLAGLVLVVRHRGGWARVLPRFSHLALWCFSAVILSGVVAAVPAIGSAAALISTGYGRLLLAKVLLAAVLGVLGWRGRTLWTPAARAHRATAGRSGARLRVEVAVMAVAVTAAAALAVTG